MIAQISKVRGTLIKVYASLLCYCLLLILLCACAPSEGQTEPTRLTAPPTVPPTTEDPMTEALTGIGTICDIAKYGDGYIILTHSGLYLLDENFSNRRSAGEQWERLFATRDDDGFWERLSWNIDEKPRLFKELIVASKGVFFCTATTWRFESYFDGKSQMLPFQWQDESGNTIESETTLRYVAEHNGHLFGATGALLFLDDKFVCRIPSRSSIVFIKMNGNLHIYDAGGATDESDIYLLHGGGEYEWVSEGWGEFSLYADYDKYCYYMQSINWYDESGEIEKTEFCLVRTDGTTHEIMNCSALGGNSGAAILRFLVKDDSHIVILRDDDSIEVAEYSFRELRTFPEKDKEAE